MLTVKSTKHGAVVTAPNGKEFLVQELIGGKSSDMKVIAKLVAEILRDGGANVNLHKPE